MDRFETQFENLDVQSQVMDSTMAASSTLNTPQTQVDSLMQEVADEAGLELNMDLPSAQSTSIGASTAASTEQVRQKNGNIYQLTENLALSLRINRYSVQSSRYIIVFLRLVFSDLELSNHFLCEDLSFRKIGFVS